MLLSCGKILYFNEKDKAVEYFSSINFKCPELTNPADYFMSIMSIESLETDDDINEDKKIVEKRIQKIYKERIEFFDKSYLESSLKNDPDFTLTSL